MDLASANYFYKQGITISDVIEMVGRVWIVDKPLKKARELPLGMADHVSNQAALLCVLVSAQAQFLRIGFRHQRTSFLRNSGIRDGS